MDLSVKGQFKLPNEKIIEIRTLEGDLDLVYWNYANEDMMHKSNQIAFCSINARFRVGKYMIYLKDLVPILGYSAEKFL